MNTLRIFSKLNHDFLSRSYVISNFFLLRNKCSTNVLYSNIYMLVHIFDYFHTKNFKKSILIFMILLNSCLGRVHQFSLPSWRTFDVKRRGRVAIKHYDFKFIRQNRSIKYFAHTGYFGHKICFLILDRI